MEEALGQHRWLACDDYTLADVAFAPYLARLEHLRILDIVGQRRRVADWYARCKARPSFDAGITRWENPNYLDLMSRRGTEHWPEVQAVVVGAKVAA
jgi:glutathione S-transferase